MNSGRSATQLVEHDAGKHRRTEPGVVVEGLEATVATAGANQREVIEGHTGSAEQAGEIRPSAADTRPHHRQQRERGGI